MIYPLEGAMVALVTPFDDGNKIDFKALAELIEFQIDNKINGIVIAGSTGEVSTLLKDEYEELIKFAANTIKKRVSLIACCSSNNTNIAVEFAKLAEKSGADCLLCTTPYYNKPSQQGLYMHFKNIHDNTRIPMILYSILGRTAVDFTDDTIIRLAEEFDRIVGMKDSGGDVERTLRLMSRNIKQNFSILAGDDSLALAFNVMGAYGVISATANFVPKFIVDIQNLWKNKKIKEAQKLNNFLCPLYKMMSIETNPVPVKYAMSLEGLCKSNVRLPLCELLPSNKKVVENVITQINNRIQISF